MNETSLGGSQRAFAPTLWTVVLKARGKSREALDELIRAYWKPVYFYVRRWGADLEDAKDLTQGFFVEFQERSFLKDVAKEKGTFRAFLLTTLKHYLINQKEHAAAKKRGGGRREESLDFHGAETEYAREPAARENLDRYFKRQWALTVLDRAMKSLAAELDPKTFEAIKPHLTRGPEYAETAAKLGVSITELNNLIHRTRTRFRELIRREVAASLDAPTRIDEEVGDLFESLKS